MYPSCTVWVRYGGGVPAWWSRRPSCGVNTICKVLNHVLTRFKQIFNSMSFDKCFSRRLDQDKHTAEILQYHRPCTPCFLLPQDQQKVFVGFDHYSIFSEVKSSFCPVTKKICLSIFISSLFVVISDSPDTFLSDLFFFCGSDMSGIFNQPLKTNCHFISKERP